MSLLTLPPFALVVFHTLLLALTMFLVDLAVLDLRGGADVMTATADAKLPLLILRGWLSDVSRISFGCLGYIIYDVYGF